MKQKLDGRRARGWALMLVAAVAFAVVSNQPDGGGEEQSTPAVAVEAAGSAAAASDERPGAAASSVASDRPAGAAASLVASDRPAGAAALPIAPAGQAGGIASPVQPEAPALSAQPPLPAGETNGTPGDAPNAAEGAAPERMLKATVTRVVDGDTLDVLVDGREERVRLIGVDAPEVRGEAEPYGAEGMAFARQRLTGQAVDLELDVEERDRYGRLLAYVWIGGELFNETLVREGYATVMTVPPNVKYAERFVALQEEAREAGTGLWGLPGGLTGGDAAVGGATGGGSAADAGSGSRAGSDAAGGVRAGSGVLLPVNGDCGGLIKGNVSSSGEKIYHTPGGAYYDRTYAEACFATPEDAEAAGYRASKR